AEVSGYASAHGAPALGLPGATPQSVFANSLGAGLAADLASSAAKSLINGSDFGSNLVKGLPDVVGSTIGETVAAQLAPPPPDISQAYNQRLARRGAANGIAPVGESYDALNDEMAAEAVGAQGLLSRAQLARAEAYLDAYMKNPNAPLPGSLTSQDTIDAEAA